MPDPQRRAVRPGVIAPTARRSKSDHDAHVEPRARQGNRICDHVRLPVVPVHGTWVVVDESTPY